MVDFHQQRFMQISESHCGPADQAALIAYSESEDSDYGHYSLVIRADRHWYDFNEAPEPISGQPVLIEDDHLKFVVVRNLVFLHRMGMRAFPL